MHSCFPHNWHFYYKSVQFFFSSFLHHMNCFVVFFSWFPHFSSEIGDVKRKHKNDTWHLSCQPHRVYLAWFLRDYHEQLVQILVQDTRYVIIKTDMKRETTRNWTNVFLISTKPLSIKWMQPFVCCVLFRRNVRNQHIFMCADRS